MSSASSMAATRMSESARPAAHFHPTGEPRMTTVSDLDTPAVTVRLDIMEDNIRRVQAHLAGHGIGNRPHIKTHKIPAIGKLQMQAGAMGITCQKIGEVEVFVDPIGNKPAVVVFGGGHVGRAVVHLAHWLGFRTVIADDRAEYASRESAPEADEHIVCPLGELAQRTRIDAMTYLVLATRGVGIDVEGLPALLDSPAAYIGIIGSRRRWETASAELEGRGVPRAGLERIHSPMGLELNAETPEEIAVSILSEIILVRRGGTGESMRHAPRPKKESRPS